MRRYIGGLVLPLWLGCSTTPSSSGAHGAGREASTDGSVDGAGGRDATMIADAGALDSGAASDGGALAQLGDAAWPFLSTTTMFPADQFQNPRNPCSDAGASCCGAFGDGVHDDTAVLQACILHGPLFLPDGTYLVSATLAWADAYDMLQGQSRAGTVIKLQDNAPGFQSADGSTGAAACVLSTSGHPTHGQTFEVSTGFNEFLSNFTVDTGSGNPNGCGVQFHGNNVNALRDVTVRSEDGTGPLGIDLTQPYPGPSFLSGVEVSGFAVGIGVARTQYSLTFEHVFLHGQSVSGIQNTDNVLNVRDLESINAVPAIQSSGAAFVTLVDSTLQGGSAAQTAIVNTAASGSLFLRNVATSGYGEALNNRGATLATLPGEYVDTVDGGPVTLFPGPAHSLDLPIEETPRYHDNDLSDWLSVGTSNGTDDTVAVQAALASGKPIVYFPSGKYFLSDTLHVPATVKQIIGAETLFAFAKTNSFSFSSTPPWKAVFSIEGGSAGDTVFLDRLMFNGNESRTPISFTAVIDNSPRTLVVREMTFGGGQGATDLGLGYLTGSGAGPVFMEDVGMQAHFINQPAWIRQYDSEGVRSTGNPYLQNQNFGSTLWILGLKTESAPTVMDTEASGQTELLGGLLYTISDYPGPHTSDGGIETAPDGGPTPDAGFVPAFVARDATVSLTFVEEIYNQKNVYSIYVEQTQNGVTKNLLTGTLPYTRDGAAHRMPLFVGQ